MYLSPEIAVMFSPTDAYRRFAERPARADHFAIGLRRPAFVALLIGSAIAMTATNRTTVGLVVSVGLCWSFVVALQTVAAAAVIAAAPDRVVSAARALDLFFLSHGPWSLWLLLVAAWAGMTADPTAIQPVALASAPVPAVWTAILVRAFCRTVLRASPHGALRITFVYQAMIWTFAAAYISVVVQVWPRLLGILGK
jgi:hypothetical protein